MSVQWFPGIFIVLIGLIITFFGYRLLKFTLIISGFGLGIYLGWFLGTKTGAAGWLGAALGIVLGIGGVLLTLWFFRLSVFLLGAIAGALLTVIFSWGSGWQQLLVVIVGALIGGVLAALIQRPVLSFLTGFVGSWWVVAGIFSLFGRTRLRLADGVEMPLIAILWLGLGVLGFLVQLLQTGRQKEK